MRQLWRHREARLYLFGQTFSGLGDSALWLAAAIWVKDLTGSAAAAGLVMFFFAVSALGGPLVGMMVDRMRRARLLITANLVGAVIVLPLLAVRDQSMVWLIFAVMLGYGVVSRFIQSGQSALLASLLPGELLATANGIMRSTREALKIIAPLVGAGLYVWLGPYAVVILDVVTFLAAAGVLVAMRLSEVRPERTETSVGQEIMAGARYIAEHPVLRWLVLGVAVAFVATGFSESGVFAAVSDGLGLDPAFVGVTAMVQGVGAVAIGLFAGGLNTRLGELRLVRLGLFGYAVSQLMLVIPSLPVVFASMALAGVALPLVGVGLVTCLQLSTPDRLQGRVYSAADLTTSVPMALSIALGAGMLSIIGYQLMFVFGAVLLSIGAWLTLGARSVRAIKPRPAPTTDRDTAVIRPPAETEPR